MRILIIGNTFSGKSFLAEKLAKIFNYKVFCLNSIIYDELSGNYRSAEEQIKLINKINRENKNYIIEGVLNESLDLLLPLSEIIIYLDLDKKLLKRHIYFKYFWSRLYFFKKSNKIDRTFLEQKLALINNFNGTQLNERLNKYSNKLIRLKSKREIRKLLRAYEASFKY